MARRRNTIYLAVDDAVISPADHAPVQLKVTYRDYPRTARQAVYRAADGALVSTPLVRGSSRGRGAFRTVTFALATPAFGNALAGGTDLALQAVRGDLEASFVRIVKR